MTAGARLGALALMAVAVAAASPCGASAQTPGVRHLSVSRGTEGVDTLRARVAFAGGLLRISPSDEDLLYHADVRYDAERARPIATFDAARGVLEIGAEAGPLSRGFGLRRSRRERRSAEPVAELILRIGTATPTELTIDVTAARGEIDLGGVPLRLLRVSASASETQVDFRRGNPERLARLDLSARAASMRVSDLAAANAEHIVASVTAGQLELLMGSDWSGDVTLEAGATLGQLRLLLPEDVGVRITARERLLGNVEGALVERDGVYSSANWETAVRRLHVTASVSFGTISVDRASR